MAWVTYSLGFAVVATALVAAGSPTALGQSPAAQTQEPSRPSAPSPADDTTSRDRRGEPPETVVESLSLFDHGLTNSAKPIVVVESWLSGVEMKCIGCRGFETTAVRPESTNANAPWAVQGKWRRRTTLGVVSTGFVSVRNYALRLSTAIPVGGDLDPAALGASGASAFLPGSQWKTLAKRANGA
jgi:hypothetical protein